jgi:hypothetical protein
MDAYDDDLAEFDVTEAEFDERFSHAHPAAIVEPPRIRISGSSFSGDSTAGTHVEASSRSHIEVRQNRLIVSSHPSSAAHTV